MKTKISKTKFKSGDKVSVKLGSKLDWMKGATVVKRRKDNITITGIWNEGVEGTLNKKFVRKEKNSAPKDKVIKQLMKYVSEKEAKEKVNKSYDYVTRIYNQDQDLTPSKVANLIMYE